nr:serine hydrolase domain-containing protein [Roseateles albus]
MQVHSPVSVQIDDYLDRSYPSHRPGAAVLLAQNGRIIHRAAYGSADMAAQSPLAVKDMFRIGSLTKQFTAAAIMCLHERKLLDVRERLHHYLPAYPAHGQNICLEHLLQHTSGIRCFTDSAGFDQLEASDLSQRQVLDLFQHEALMFAPGAQFSYSNSGYFLLGLVIEKVSGRALAHFFQEEFFAPLGMHATALEGHAGIWPIQGYTEDPDLQAAPPISMATPFAAGALVSTVDDLFRWEQQVGRAGVLSVESWQRMWQPSPLPGGASSGYGYGFETRSIDGLAVVDHDGGISGFSAYSARTLDKSLFVCVLSNNDSGEPSTIEVGEQLIRILAR